MYFKNILVVDLFVLILNQKNFLRVLSIVSEQDSLADQDNHEADEDNDETECDSNQCVVCG